MICHQTFEIKQPGLRLTVRAEIGFRYDRHDHDVYDVEVRSFEALSCWITLGGAEQEVDFDPERAEGWAEAIRDSILEGENASKLAQATADAIGGATHDGRYEQQTAGTYHD